MTMLLSEISFSFPNQYAQIILSWIPEPKLQITDQAVNSRNMYHPKSPILSTSSCTLGQKSSEICCFRLHFIRVYV